MFEQNKQISSQVQQRESKVTPDEPAQKVDQKSVWHLYGQTYDLSQFMKKHPGGQNILKVTKGHQDVTSMFESYHVFANIDSIKESLETYKVGKSDYPVLSTFEKDGFYQTVADRVKTFMGEGKNVNRKVKINNFWIIKLLSITLSLLINTYMAFFNMNIPVYQGVIHSIIAAGSLMSLGFCIFHDATHFALFQGLDSKRNDTIARIVGAMMLWSTEMWMYHHAFRHHAYTGSEELDPDVQNYHPFIRKTAKIMRKKTIQFSSKILPYIASFTLFIFPGQFLGQIVAYWFMWRRKSHLWKMDYPAQIVNRKAWENAIFFFAIFQHFFRFNIYITAAYWITLNLTYSLSIVPDHDTNETALNHADLGGDWGEMQVRNSGNFLNGNYCDIFHHIFGGINYQIEHHLFPSMCGVHLNKIAPIVKQTCQEFNVPYVNQPSIVAAYKDFIKSIVRVNDSE